MDHSPRKLMVRPEPWVDRRIRETKTFISRKKSELADRDGQKKVLELARYGNKPKWEVYGYATRKSFLFNKYNHWTYVFLYLLNFYNFLVWFTKFIFLKEPTLWQHTYYLVPFPILMFSMAFCFWLWRFKTGGRLWRDPNLGDYTTTGSIRIGGNIINTAGAITGRHRLQ